MLQPTPTVMPLDFGGIPQHPHADYHNVIIGQPPVYYDSSDEEEEDSDEDLSVSVDGSMTVSEARKTPWVVRANACAMEADQASKQQRWRRAMRKHQKASEWFQYAVEDTSHPDMKRDLFALSQNHNHKAMELRRLLDAEALRQQQVNIGKEGNRGFDGENGTGQQNDDNNTNTNIHTNMDSSRYYESDLDYSSISPEAAEELNAILGAWRQPGGMPEKVEREESWFKEGLWFTVEKLFQDFFPKLPATTIVTSPRSSMVDPFSALSPTKQKDVLRVSDDEWVQTSTAPTPPPRSSIRLGSPPLNHSPGRSNSSSSIPEEDDLTSSSFFLLNVSGTPGRRSLATSEDTVASFSRSPSSSSPPPPLSANSSVSSLSASDHLKQQPGTVSGQTISFDEKPSVRHLGSDYENELQKLSHSDLIEEIVRLREQLRSVATENERLSRAQQEGVRLFQENESLKSSVIRFRDEIQKKANHFRQCNPSRFGASMTTLPNFSSSSTVMDPSMSLNPASASVMNPRRITSPDRANPIPLPHIRRPTSPSVAVISGMMASGMTSPKTQPQPLSSLHFPSPPSSSSVTSTYSPSSLEPRVHELEALVSHLSVNLEEMTGRCYQAEQALRRYEQWRNRLNTTAQKRKKNVQTQKIAEQLGISAHDPSTSTFSSSSTFPASMSQFCCPSSSTSTSSSSSTHQIHSQTQSQLILPSSSSSSSTSASVLSSFDPTTTPGLEPLLSSAQLSASQISSSTSLANLSLPTTYSSASTTSSSPPPNPYLTTQSIPITIPVLHTFSSSPPPLSPI